MFCRNQGIQGGAVRLRVRVRPRVRVRFRVRVMVRSPGPCGPRARARVGVKGHGCVWGITALQSVLSSPWGSHYVWDESVPP